LFSHPHHPLPINEGILYPHNNHENTLHIYQYPLSMDQLFHFFIIIIIIIIIITITNINSFYQNPNLIPILMMKKILYDATIITINFAFNS
jgi:hypothetical protein